MYHGALSQGSALCWSDHGSDTMSSINKRKFLATATAASVCIALDGSQGQAQQSAKSHVLGMLINGGPSPLVDSVRRQLAEDFAKLGYIEGKDLIVEPRFAHNQLAGC
jgi:hypothetical protein